MNLSLQMGDRQQREFRVRLRRAWILGFDLTVMLYLVDNKEAYEILSKGVLTMQYFGRKKAITPIWSLAVWAPELPTA